MIPYFLNNRQSTVVKGIEPTRKTLYMLKKLQYNKEMSRETVGSWNHHDGIGIIPRSHHTHFIYFH